MARVLVTGMSGAGKSTLLAAVAGRGYRTVDTDYDRWMLRAAQWDEPRMSALLAEQPTIAVSGTAENQGRFYDRFDHVIYLYVPLQALLDRVRRRSNNPYGKTPTQQADIAKYSPTSSHGSVGLRPSNSMGSCRCRYSPTASSNA